MASETKNIVVDLEPFCSIAILQTSIFYLGLTIPKQYTGELLTMGHRTQEGSFFCYGPYMMEHIYFRCVFMYSFSLAFVINFDDKLLQNRSFRIT